MILKKKEISSIFLITHKLLVGLMIKIGQAQMTVPAISKRRQWS